MRSYIFTAHERETIRAFLDGRIRKNDKAVSQIRWRLDLFKELASDVDLYLLLEHRLAKPETTISA